MMSNDFHAKNMKQRHSSLPYSGTHESGYTSLVPGIGPNVIEEGEGRTVELCLLEGSQVWLDFSLGN